MHKIKNETRHEYLYLFLLLAGVFVFQMFVYCSGFPGASGDDFFHALMAHEWGQFPFLTNSSFGSCSSVWFPTHFWITGLVYKITHNLVFSLTSISVIFGLIELFFLFHLAKILFNKRTGYISILLVGFLPWQVWLDISMTEMTLYYASILGGFLFFFKWQKESRPSYLLGSSVFLLLSTMFRPEGWIFASLFSIYLLIFLVKNYHHLLIKRIVILSIIIPTLFMVFWFIYNYREFGNPIYFLTSQRELFQGQLERYAPSWVIESHTLPIRILKFPFFMFIVSPILFLLTAVSIVARFRSITKYQRNCLFFALMQLIFMAIISVDSDGSPLRYVLINVVLLAPFTAGMLDSILQKKRGYAFVVSILFVFLGINCVKSFYYSTNYTDIAKVGKLLKKDFESGLIKNSEQISSELAFRRITGNLLATQKDFFLLSSRHAALAVHSGKPRNFLFNILQIEDIDVIKGAQSSDDINKYTNPYTTSMKLKNLQIKKIILENRELMDSIPHNFHLEETLGKYVIFSNGNTGKPSSFDKPNEDRGMNLVDEMLSDGVNLKGYRYNGSIFPGTISLLWELKKGFSVHKQYKLKITFLYLYGSENKFERIIEPIFCWYGNDSITKSVFIKDNIPLFLPKGMPSGDYSVKVSLTEQRPDSLNSTAMTNKLTKEEVFLPHVTLIYSKKRVLVEFLRNENHDWKLLAKTLITL